MDLFLFRCAKLLFLLVVHICNCEDVTVNADTLRFVHVVWRHGDRSPADPTFPTDTNNPVWSWPQGWGELTEIGMRQHYALGAILRERYAGSGFLLKNYNASQIYVRSSDYNRTIMSALSNLAGMYPPSENGSRWQPIPVHVMPKVADPMLWTDRPCPKAEDIYFNQVLESDQAKKVEEEYADLLTYLRQQTGHPLSTLDDVRYVYDPLNCELIHNDTHTWPAWVTMPLFNSIQQLYSVSKTFSFHDPRLQRFRGSLLFLDIAQRNEAKAKNAATLQPADLKYYAYSAHDTTIIALLENLGAYDAHPPDYASALLFELHEIDSKYIIQTWYFKETGSRTPVRVFVKNCGPSGDCTLETFVQMARQQTPTDWFAECGFEEPVSVRKYKRVSTAAEALGATTALLLILLIITTALLVKKPNAIHYVA